MNIILQPEFAALMAILGVILGFVANLRINDIEKK